MVQNRQSVLADNDRATGHLLSARTTLSEQFRDAAEGRRGIGHYRFLQDLCREIYTLPTMRGLVACTPELTETPIFTYFSNTTELGYYNHAYGVGISTRVRTGNTDEAHFAHQVATLPHELRHAYHEYKGCEDLPRLNHVQNRLDELIRFRRVVEADCTVLSIAVAFEAAHIGRNPHPLREAREVHPDSVDAYIELGSDKKLEGHYDGRAAQAAFEAYFSKGNIDRLRDYDRDVLNDFKKAKLFADTRFVTRNELEEDWYRYMRPVSSMPYMNEEGRIAERPNYRPLAFENVMYGVTNEIYRVVNKMNYRCAYRPG